MRKTYYLLILTSVIVLLYSCSSNVPECVTKFHKGVTIKWGIVETGSDKVKGYKLDEFGKLSYIYSDSSGNQVKENKIDYVERDLYCRILNETNKVTISTQALNAPGEKVSKFIEFSMPMTNVSSRARWNPKYANIGSKKHRILYDSLMKLVPKEHMMFDSLKKSSYIEDK